MCVYYVFEMVVTGLKLEFAVADVVGVFSALDVVIC